MEIPLAPIQVIDAFFDCTLTEAEINFLQDIPFNEMYAMVDQCAHALRLKRGTEDNGADYVTEPGIRCVHFRDLSGRI